MENLPRIKSFAQIRKYNCVTCLNSLSLEHEICCMLCFVKTFCPDTKYTSECVVRKPGLY